VATAAGVNSTVRQLGGVLGIAAGLLVMRDSAQSEAAEAMPNASMAPDAPEADTT